MHALKTLTIYVFLIFWNPHILWAFFFLTPPSPPCSSIWSYQSEPDKFKCLRTQKLPQLIQSWSKQKCWIHSNLTVLNYGTEALCRVGTFMLFKFRFTPFHAQNWTSQHTHTHTHLDSWRCQVSITVHNQSLNDLRQSKQHHQKEIGHL